MNMLTRNGLRLFGLGLVLTFAAGFFHPAPGWMLDFANVLGAAAVINLGVSFGVYLAEQREERRKLAANRARYVEAMERQNGPMQLMMFQLPAEPPSLCVRCEIHRVRQQPRFHVHQGPREYDNGIRRISTSLRGCYGDCVPCVACGEYHLGAT